MTEYHLDNDVRGWIMTIISGIACVVGSSIICIDLVLRHFPGWKDFSIQDSGVFLACSMSLSFGVMIFSALFSMLPSSKRYLEKAGLSAEKSAWILFGCFVVGFIGIQTISRFLHSYIPSHVVDCDHTHDGASTQWNSRNTTRSSSHSRSRDPHSRCHSHGRPPRSPIDANAKDGESTPLLKGGRIRAKSCRPNSHDGPSLAFPDQRPAVVVDRRPSMVQVQNRVLSFVKDIKSNCDEAGPCFGYSEPCGQECVKNFLTSRNNTLIRSSTTPRVASFFHCHPTATLPAGGLDEDVETLAAEVRSPSRGASSHNHAGHECHADSGAEDLEVQHHHHVPENAFMSIGLQTSIAIALHKLPEGFITYATNHASPELGFSVFMALFIHNITEGFAMALPLYLALGSRAKAMFWSSLLGGVSQPLGAGVAAAWFGIAGHRGGDDDGPGFAVYGCMFAVTAGIMTSVALQLFVEGLAMCHRKQLCIGCAFLGMSVLAMSNALTAH